MGCCTSTELTSINISMNFNDGEIVILVEQRKIGMQCDSIPVSQANCTGGRIMPGIVLTPPSPMDTPTTFSMESMDHPEPNSARLFY